MIEFVNSGAVSIKLITLFTCLYSNPRVTGKSPTRPFQMFVITNEDIICNGPQNVFGYNLINFLFTPVSQGFHYVEQMEIKEHGRGQHYCFLGW